jgi:hypothetical protein
MTHYLFKPAASDSGSIARELGISLEGVIVIKHGGGADHEPGEIEVTTPTLTTAQETKLRDIMTQQGLRE